MDGFLQIKGDKIYITDGVIDADVCAQIAANGQYATELLAENCANISAEFINCLRDTRIKSASFHSCIGSAAGLEKFENIRTLIIVDSPDLRPCIDAFLHRMRTMTFFRYINDEEEFTYKSHYASTGYILLKNITIGTDYFTYIKYDNKTKHTEYGSWSDYCLIRKGRVFGI